MRIVALAAALMIIGLPAALDAADAPPREEPGKVEQAKQDIKSGARQAGREVKEGAKEVGAGAKRGWHAFKRGAAEAGRGVKNFFSRLWNG